MHTHTHTQVLVAAPGREVVHYGRQSHPSIRPLLIPLCIKFVHNSDFCQHESARTQHYTPPRNAAANLQGIPALVSRWERHRGQMRPTHEEGRLRMKMTRAEACFERSQGLRQTGRANKTRSIQDEVNRHR